MNALSTLALAREKESHAGYACGRLCVWREDGLLAAHTGVKTDNSQLGLWIGPSLIGTGLMVLVIGPACAAASLCLKTSRPARLGLTCGLGLGPTWPVESCHSLGHAGLFC